MNQNLNRIKCIKTSKCTMHRNIENEFQSYYEPVEETGISQFWINFLDGLPFKTHSDLKRVELIGLTDLKHWQAKRTEEGLHLNVKIITSLEGNLITLYRAGDLSESYHSLSLILIRKCTCVPDSCYRWMDSDITKRCTIYLPKFKQG